MLAVLRRIRLVRKVVSADSSSHGMSTPMVSLVWSASSASKAANP